MPRAPKPTASPFPLFKLPLIPLEEIMNNFDTIELLEFSTLSKRSAHIVRMTCPSVKPKVDIDIALNFTIKFYKDIKQPVLIFEAAKVFLAFSKILSFDLSVEKVLYQTTLHFQNTEHDLEWCIGSFTMPKKTESLRIANVNGTKRIAPKVTKRQPIPSKLLYVTNCPRRSEPAMSSALKHLYFLFPKMRVHDLTLNSHHVSLNAKLALTPVSSIANLHINCHTINSNVRFLMENVTVKREFICKARNSIGFGFADKLQCLRQIESSNTLWMDPSKLLELNCRHVKLQSTRISTRDFEDFVEAWLADKEDIDEKKYWNIRSLEVELISDGHVFEYQRFGAQQWDGMRRPENFIYDDRTEVNCSHALDITKENGTIASIHITGLNQVKFYVWPKRDSDYPTFLR